MPQQPNPLEALLLLAALLGSLPDDPDEDVHEEPEIEEWDDDFTNIVNASLRSLSAEDSFEATFNTVIVLYMILGIGPEDVGWNHETINEDLRTITALGNFMDAVIELGKNVDFTDPEDLEDLADWFADPANEFEGILILADELADKTSDYNPVCVALHLVLEKYYDPE